MENPLIQALLSGIMHTHKVHASGIKYTHACRIMLIKIMHGQSLI